jgi:hypothetical protein
MLEHRGLNESDVVLQQTVPLSLVGDKTFRKTFEQPSCRILLGINLTALPLYRIPASITAKHTLK